MPPAVRKGDKCTGHGCWGSRPNDQGSPDVFFNGRPAHRKGDHWATHCCKSCHDSQLAQGSPTVFTNNRQQGRKGDPVACGSKVAEGSPDIFIGSDGDGTSGNSSTTENNTPVNSGGSSGGGSGGGSSGPGATGVLNVDKATQSISANANDSSTGYCARSVRQALEVGGLDTSGRPTSAKNYGPYLEDSGFQKTDMSGYTPQKGDIVVSQPYPGGSPHGHIAMYDGTKWVSDFKQNDMYGGPGYRSNPGGSQVYRPGPNVGQTRTA